jgi:hypothetical protein
VPARFALIGLLCVSLLSVRVWGFALPVTVPAQGSSGPAAALAPQEQNALIARHCTVCHNDTTPNGGLSLTGFDVERAQASLIAIMLSKMSQGLSVATLQAAHERPAAKRLVATRMKGGAMLAAGIAPPPDTTMYALIESLAGRTAGALEWHVAGSGARDRGRVFTASLLREAPRSGDGEVQMYRLIATCDERSRTGELRLSWSPLPTEGTLRAAVDDAAPIAVEVRGFEKMGNGLPGETPPASVVLATSGRAGAPARFTLPAYRLVVTGLHGDTVDFPFSTLPRESRRILESCFPR